MKIVFNSSTCGGHSCPPGLQDGLWSWASVGRSSRPRWTCCTDCWESCRSSLWQRGGRQDSSWRQGWGWFQLQDWAQESEEQDVLTFCIKAHDCQLEGKFVVISLCKFFNHLPFLGTDVGETDGVVGVGRRWSLPLLVGEEAAGNTSSRHCLLRRSFSVYSAGCSSCSLWGWTGRRLAACSTSFSSSVVAGFSLRRSGPGTVWSSSTCLAKLLSPGPEQGWRHVDG